MPHVVNDGAQLEATALQLLRSVPGVVAVDTEFPVGDGRRVDGIIQFSDRRLAVVFEVKRHANAAAAWQLIDQARQLGREAYRYILIAGDTTAGARALLTEHGIGLIDGLGNAHIELPGLLLHTERGGRKTGAAVRTAAPRLTGKAGVVAQALLLEPQRTWKVADVARTAQVSVGLAHRVLARLEAENVLASEGSGPQRVRRVLNPTVLLDLWAEETAAERPHRTLAYVVARTPEARLKDVAANIGFMGEDYAVTGAAAATLLAPFVTAIPTLEVWLPSRLSTEDLLRAARAEQADEGANVVLLQAKGDTGLAFTRQHGDVWIANVFRLYADLRRDPRRGREQADHLREELIGF
jgi:hypothetical protein